MRCSQSINSSGGYLDLGIAGGDLSTYYSSSQNFATNNTAVGYARVIIPLGKRPKRIDCSQLYQLEIERLKAEIEALQIGLE